MKTMLVVGATGVIGEACLAHFGALPDWRVIALSRRIPDGLGHARHLALDLTDATACRAAAGELTEVTHVVYAAVSEQPGLVVGWRDPAQMELNRAMLGNLLDSLVSARGLRHVTLLQGAKAYGAHAGIAPRLPAREREPRVEHPNFYWLQEELLRDWARAHDLGWTVFRPGVIVGGAWGAVMNPLLAIGAYAAIRREESKSFAYPGGVPQIGELVDAGLLAEAFAWAAEAPAARHETFNVTNGDVFAWRTAWPAIARTLGVETGPDEPLSLAAYLIERADIWDRVVAREGLRALNLARFLGESHHYADVLLQKDATAIRLPTLLSTIKLRQAGFAACRDSEDVVCGWLAEMQARRLLPPA
ncbi:NAD-dependent epimerase/dehydratase family protein [Novosphingobium sp. JCM 18896]|uniref:NAD-dependent epimerase/dehydratase family protein n=1 Tax=Novosphingobium sp. JCM 18896 TaxID=2989731 RepID=UPI002222E9B1|nr:NAD-dependent epimerase/dehydratase family protein [Novosphingobium sp. JCM 18896]MCW1428376.1 NAD-dependent epimerase/dehydratase family protein [Novosphingobium sp. JCM 18896]